MTYLNTQVMSQMRSVYNLISNQPASEDRNELIASFLVLAEKLEKLRGEEVKHNTQLHYLYRDASNYKTWNSVILEGEITPEQYTEMQECCEDHHEMFIPEQLGLDLIRDWETTEDDHPYAELDGYEYTNESRDVAMTVDELLDRFRKAKGNWRPEDYAPEIDDDGEEEDE